MPNIKVLFSTCTYVMKIEKKIPKISNFYLKESLCV